MEPVIVVVAKPDAPSPAKSHWILYLLSLNFVFFVYHCMTEDYSHTGDFVFFFLAYVAYGVYLPVYGLNCLAENNPTHTFVVWQSSFSVCHLMYALFNVVLYYNYEDMCRECMDVFLAGHDACETLWMDSVTEITLDKCMQLPDEETLWCKHSVGILVSLVGLLTSYKVSRVEPKTSTVEAIQVSDPEVIAQILEQRVDNV
jgi:hypothetical protein